jgi:alpha-glucosidase (family GH31 glycosyl hydrolase)
MVKVWLEGGSFIRPMFLDFRSDTYKDKLYTMDDQFMLGSNIMVSPVIYPGDRKKKTYFPDELFYNLYNGKIMNPNGEGYIQVDAPLESLPIYIRAGFITPVQDTVGITMVNQLRNKPFEVIIALDSNFRAAGRIFFDDGFSDRTIVDKEYYRMDIIANMKEGTKTMEIIFKYFDYNFDKSIYFLYR